MYSDPAMALLRAAPIVGVVLFMVSVVADDEVYATAVHAAQPWRPARVKSAALELEFEAGVVDWVVLCCRPGEGVCAPQLRARRQWLRARAAGATRAAALHNAAPPRSTTLRRRGPPLRRIRSTMLLAPLMMPSAGKSAG